MHRPAPRPWALESQFPIGYLLLVSRRDVTGHIGRGLNSTYFHMPVLLPRASDQGQMQDL